MKKLIPLALLLLVLLCGCTRNSYPTAPTTQPTEAPDPMLSELDDLGRVCGVVADGDGYIFMTHTGFYRFNSELKRADSSDLSALNQLFAVGNDASNPFSRMKNSPDYDKSLLTALTKTSRGLMFFCYGNSTFYLNGEPYEVLSKGVVSAGESVQILEHDGAIYTLVRGEKIQYFSRNGERYEMPARNSTYEMEGERVYTGMFVLDGQLYVGIGSYADSSLIPSDDAQMSFLVPVSAESTQLSYDGCRTGYGNLGAYCAGKNGDYFYFTASNVSSSTGVTYTPEKLLRISGKTSEVVSLAALGDDGKRPVAIVERADGGLLILTHRADVILSEVEVTETQENVVLTLGTLADSADYGICEIPMYYAALANSARVQGKNLSVFLRFFDSGNALIEAVEAGEIDIVGTAGLEAMQLLAERGKFKNLYQTNSNLFAEDGLCPAVVHTFAKDGSAYFIPTQLSAQTTLLYAEKSTSLWTQDAQPVEYSPDEIAALFEAVSVKDKYTALDLYSSSAKFSDLLDAFIGGNVDFAAGTATLNEGTFAALLEFCARFGSKEFLQELSQNPMEAYDILSRQTVKIESAITLNSIKTAVTYLRNNVAALPMEAFGANGTQLYAGYYIAICDTENATLAAEALPMMLSSVPIGTIETEGEANLPVLQSCYAGVTLRTYIIDGINYSAQARAMLDIAFYGDAEVTVRDARYEAVKNALHDVAKAYFNGGMTTAQAVEKAQSMVENILAAS